MNHRNLVLRGKKAPYRKECTHCKVLEQAKQKGKNEICSYLWLNRGGLLCWSIRGLVQSDVLFLDRAVAYLCVCMSNSFNTPLKDLFIF